MSRVSHLEFDVARTFIDGGVKEIMSSTAPNQQLNMIVFAEVPKVVQVVNGSYRVGYL